MVSKSSAARRLSPPARNFSVSGSQAEQNSAKVFGPCVYVIKQAGADEILYVGMSIHGIVRLNDSKHRGLLQARAHDDVIVQLHFCPDAKTAADLESGLILKHRPKYNATVDLRYVERRRSGEER